ncbi:MAG: hypothetical protein VZQ84_03255 [Anaerovoracaceae bacterium]|nr:hypothetical protein [Anaerovoracaceae bacterium]
MAGKYDDRINKYGSFFFVRNISGELYDRIRAVETAAVESPETMGDTARDALEWFLENISLRFNNLNWEECRDYYNGRHPAHPGETKLHILIWCAYEVKQIPVNVNIFPERYKDGKRKKTRNMDFMDKFCDDWGAELPKANYKRKFKNSPRNIVLFMQSFYYIISGYFQFYHKAPDDLPDYDYKVSLGLTAPVDVENLESPEQ